MVSSNYISAQCEYNNSLVTGFQMIAQLNVLTEVQRIHAAKAIDGQTSARVFVPESGKYQVTIFAIKERQGILNSGVEISQEVSVLTTATNNQARGRQLNKVFQSF